MTILRRDCCKKKHCSLYESISSVALRVSNPLPGYSYGIKWRVPTLTTGIRNPSEGAVTDIVNRLIHKNIIRRSKRMLAFLRTVDNTIWRELLSLSVDERLDVGIMVYDQKNKKMVMLSDVLFSGNPQKHKWQDYSRMEFRYGEGIAGKAFKTNKARLYIKPEPSLRRYMPDYYLRIEGTTDHAILLCMPIQNPQSPDQVYGVMCCGGYSKNAKLWDVMHEAEETQVKRLRGVQQAINDLCAEVLKTFVDLR